MSVSSRTRGMMRLRGLTIGELAKATGLSIGSIRYVIYYRKRIGASLSFIRKIARALGCTPGWLLQDKEWLHR